MADFEGNGFPNGFDCNFNKYKPDEVRQVKYNSMEGVGEAQVILIKLTLAVIPIAVKIS